MVINEGQRRFKVYWNTDKQVIASFNGLVDIQGGNVIFPIISINYTVNQSPTVTKHPSSFGSAAQTSRLN